MARVKNPAYKKMNVVSLPTSSLIEYSLNSRNHPQEQIDRIATSISEFGFNQPIVVDEDKIILAGHGRLAAARKLGLAEVPTVVVEGLSSADKRAYRILDNKLQGDSTWDLDTLGLELNALEEDGFDLEPWGLDDLIPEPGMEGIEAVEDEFEAEQQVEIYIKRKDIIELGRHRVMCGDSTSADDVGELMSGETAKLVFTDPPYGIDYQDVKGHFDKIANDAESPTQLLQKVLELVPKIPTYLCCNWRCLQDMADAMTSEGFEPKACIVWDKLTRIQNLDKFAKRHEFILYSGPYGGQPTIDEDVWQVARQTTSGHPTSKPIALCARAIGYSSKTGDVVYEPFAGSGSTLIACEQLGRTCYGMELEPKYCQVIIERYKAYCDKQKQPFECKINGELFNGRPETVAA